MRHFWAALFAGCVALAQSPLYQNPDAPLEKRVDDLLSRMTPEEKVSQMMNDSPAIERLGIPAYNWWNECLHGVARAGRATVFPMPIGLAATWDPDLMFRLATAISDEARAKNNEFIRRGKRSIYQGLTFWTPNINLVRDPRWGRGMEAYGEDPYLVGRMAVQFIKGLQGNDPKYLKVVATAKHFAVHSGPESSRHSFDAKVEDEDLMKSYLPHFEAAVKQGGAYSVMCAYNRVDGDPACASPRLLGDILRKQWGFSGYVVSDCGAVGDIFRGHKVASSMAAAAAHRREGRHRSGLRHRIPRAHSSAGTEADRAVRNRYLGAPPAHRALPPGHVRPARARAVHPHSALRGRFQGASGPGARSGAQIDRPAQESGRPAAAEEIPQDAGRDRAECR